MNKPERHDVYRNLNKARKDRTVHVWSIRLTGGKVQGHSENVILSGVEFKVSESTRQRILKQERRSVCAFIRGTLITPSHVPDNPLHYGATGSAIPCLAGKRVRVSFNPYKSPTFYRCDTGTPVTAADAVIFTSDGAFAVNPR